MNVAEIVDAYSTLSEDAGQGACVNWRTKGTGGSVRILLDENMPRKLLAALVAEGHEVDSVKSLELVGIDNRALYQMAASSYDLCFTRDVELSRRVVSKPAERLNWYM
jgi:hypothetical protein